jgi:putative ATPase
MLHAGEDIRFIARRLVIAASEDVGLADSRGLLIAVATQHACETIGIPEAEIPLAHAAVYLATAPKSNSSFAGLSAAKHDVANGSTLAVPGHLKSGGRYKNPHDFHGGLVPQAYLPEGRIFYQPSERGEEKRIGERLSYWKSCFEREEEMGTRSSS